MMRSASGRFLGLRSGAQVDRRRSGAEQQQGLSRVPIHGVVFVLHMWKERRVLKAETTSHI